MTSETSSATGAHTSSSVTTGRGLRFNTERLRDDGSNYAQWARELPIVLEQAGGDPSLWDRAAQKPAAVLSALHVMVMNVAPELQAQVLAADSATQAWDHFTTQFRPNNRLRTAALMRELHNFKYSPGEAMTAFLQRFNAIVRPLADIGHAVPDETQVTLLLEALPSEYSSFVGAELRSASVKTVLELTHPLYDMERRVARDGTAGLGSLMASFAQLQQSHGPEFAAHVAQFQPQQQQQQRQQQQQQQQRGRHGGGRQGGRHIGGRGRSDRPRRPFDESLYCDFCQRTGHDLSTCWGHANSMRFQAEQQARRSRTPAAHSASAQNDASPAGGFLLDSGATQHMHSSRAAYVEYSRLSAPVHITFGAGDTRPAVGIGSIYLLPTDGGHPVIMTDVLHVPELLRPLLSVSQLLKRGCKINFADDEPIVISNAGQALLRVRHTGDLFIVLAIVRAGSAHSASGVCHDPVLWHRRFGHLSHQGLARLQRLGLVTGLPVTAAQFLEQHKLRVVCEPCVLGQHRSRPFPPSKTRPSRPLSRLHSDLSGPLPVRALCGGQYLCTITDHFTGFGLVTALKDKSDAPAAIEDGIRLLENHAAAASSVQFLRSDNGGEYINARMQRICADRGIAHETSAPHTPQQNGLAERRNLTIMNCARSMLVESGLPQVF